MATSSRKAPRLSPFAGPAEVARPRILLIASVFFLAVVGLVMVFSSSSIEAINEGASPAENMVRQLAYLAISLVACVGVVVVFPYDRLLGVLLDLFWWVAFALLVLTALIGTIGLGAKRWLSLGPVSFQPSEFAKVALLLMFARILYQARTEEMDGNRLFSLVGFFILLPLAVMLVLQSDLGTTMICIVGMLAVLFLSGAPLRTVFLTMAIVFALGVFAIVLVSYRSDRFAFLNPEQDYYGAGYQLIRSFYAFGEGGLLGVGLGNSSEKYLYLPEAETDFIFAIIAEEMGLVGALLVVAAFMVLLWSGLQIAKHAPDLFGSMVAGGATAMLVFQAFLNIGCVIGILPTTGKPLPFISSGGTALLGAFLLVGVILSVSFATDGVESVYTRRRDELRVVRSSSKAKAPSRGGKNTNARGASGRSRRSKGR